jgi:hypothetical protein
VALNSDNVRVAVTGAMYVGATATAKPTSASSALPAGFNDLGYFSDDGVTETRDRSTNSIRGWQKAALLREVVTEAALSFQGVLVETKKETVELYYGSPVDTSDGSIRIDPANTGGRQSFVLDIIDGDELIRAYIPSGEITDVGDQQYVSGDAIGYDVTVSAYLVTDEDGDTYSAIKWYSSLVEEEG